MKQSPFPQKQHCMLLLITWLQVIILTHNKLTDLTWEAR